jgi:hypothetical protein
MFNKILPGYFSHFLVPVGGQQVEKNAEIPDPVLGIGPAEVLAPQPLKYKLMNPARQRVDMQVGKDQGDLQNMNTGDKFISREDFPAWGWVGDSY